jgi:hypothetical protein
MFSERLVDLGCSNRLDSGKFELISAVSFVRHLNHVQSLNIFS